MAQVRDAKHEIKPAVVRSDDNAIAEKNPGRRPGEPDKDQTGDHREPDHAEKDLDRDDDVAVKVRRKIVTVADGRQRFDAEEKRFRIRTWSQVGDGIAAENIEGRKDEVDDDIAGKEKKRETRPAQRKDPVITVAPAAGGGVDLEKLSPSRASRDRSAWSMFHSDCFPTLNGRARLCRAAERQVSRFGSTASRPTSRCRAGQRFCFCSLCVPE